MSDTPTAIKRRGRPPRTQPVEPAADNNMPSEAYVTEASGLSPASERPSMRPSMREEDPRVAAARRAAEIRGHLGNTEDSMDKFRTPPAPPGWEYEWKRRLLLGQEDPSYQVALARMGWEPVPTYRHPEMMPLQGNHPTIERDGMILMQRPGVISDEARAAELSRARNQVRVKEQQLNATPDGTLTRDHPSARPQIKKGYEPIAVPES